MLLKYEVRLSTDCGGVLGSPGQRKTRINDLNYFPSREFINKSNANVFRNGSR